MKQHLNKRKHLSNTMPKSFVPSLYISLQEKTNSKPNGSKTQWTNLICSVSLSRGKEKLVLKINPALHHPSADSNKKLHVGCQVQPHKDH